MKLKPLIFTALWIAALATAWFSTPWRDQGPDGTLARLARDGAFHMHQPLHEGGRVRMVGQLHLELVARPSGRHSLWISNAFRQEMDPAGFEGTLTIEGALETALPFERVARTRELVCRTGPLTGQLWLRVDGRMGRDVTFDGAGWFWDFEPGHPAASEVPLGLDSMRPVPTQNQPTPEKIALGRDLFFDPDLSADGSISCATCHQPEHAYAEARAVARGTGGRTGQRNTPSLLNSAYLRALFFDGRSGSLEEQALDPILNHAEMGVADVASLVARLEPRYGERSRAAFGLPLSADTLGMALAAFERTLLSGDSDHDRYEHGEEGALSPEALQGRALFFGKAGCGNCHTPPLFTDSRYHNLGVGWGDEGPADRGRFEVTGAPADLGAFRTPSLRDVSRTAPYMHDGSHGTLREVVEFYDGGCRANEALSPMVAPLGLEEAEIDGIVAFLETLDGRSYALAAPQSTGSGEHDR